MSHHRLSQRRACALLRHPRSTHCYRSVKDPQLALRQRMREIAQVRVRYGYRRIHVLLRREGWKHFETLQHASRVIGDWIGFYNHRRPHQALGMKTPAEAFALAT